MDLLLEIVLRYRSQFCMESFSLLLNFEWRVIPSLYSRIEKLFLENSVHNLTISKSN